VAAEPSEAVCARKNAGVKGMTVGSSHSQLHLLLKDQEVKLRIKR